MEEALAAGNLKAVAEYDRAFHNIFRCNSGNKRLEYTLGSLMDQVDRLLYYAKNDPERTRQSVREHRKVFEAVRKGDTRGAEQAMYAHISGLKAYHLSWVQEYMSKAAGF
jgi:DNA-binding GntR family transcriptional regulator